MCTLLIKSLLLVLVRRVERASSVEVVAAFSQAQQFFLLREVSYCKRRNRARGKLIINKVLQLIGMNHEPRNFGPPQKSIA